MSALDQYKSSPYQDTKFYVGDQLHRLDGPAIVYARGRTEWYFHGKHITKTEIKRTTGIKDLRNLSDDDKLILKLTYGVDGEGR